MSWDGEGEAGYAPDILGRRFDAGLIFQDGFESGDTSAWTTP